MAEAVEALVMENRDIHDTSIQERMSIVDSLIGIIPADITLKEAREERLGRL